MNAMTFCKELRKNKDVFVILRNVLFFFKEFFVGHTHTYK